MTRTHARANVILGLNGIAKSGKDTACGYIMDWAMRRGREVERDAFADRLKISAAHSLGVFENPINFCNNLKETGEIRVTMMDADYSGHGYFSGTITGREYLQYYGTEGHREVFHTDFWVDAVLPHPDHPYCGRDPFDILVITDVRFSNEAIRIKECGGEVWQIIRSSEVKGDAHASEQELPSELIERRIFNEGTLDEFRNEVEALAERRLYVTA